MVEKWSGVGYSVQPGKTSEKRPPFKVERYLWLRSGVENGDGGERALPVREMGPLGRVQEGRGSGGPKKGRH